MSDKSQPDMETPRSTLPRTYRPEDLAKILHTNREVIYRWVKQGKIPSRLVARVDQQMYFPADLFDEWLRNGMNRDKEQVTA